MQLSYRLLQRCSGLQKVSACCLPFPATSLSSLFSHHGVTKHYGTASEKCFQLSAEPHFPGIIKQRRKIQKLTSNSRTFPWLNKRRGTCTTVASIVTLWVFLCINVSCTFIFSQFLKQLPQLPQVKVSYHFAASA